MSISDEQTTTIAKHMAHAALDWIDFETDGHSHTPECSNWGAFLDDATTLTAALASTPEASDDYEAGYNEGFHHGRSTPRVEASDDEPIIVKAMRKHGTGTVVYQPDNGPKLGTSARSFLAEIDYARRSPVPADTPSEGAMGRAIAEAEDRRSLAEAEANGWPITPVRAAMTLDETADFIAARLAHPTPPKDVAVEVAAFRHEVEFPPDSEVMVLVTRHLARSVLAALAAVPAGGEAEWEYGFTSKWGVLKRRSEAGAVMDADLLRGSIRVSRESGDLEYHGKVVRRLVTRTGPWLPIPGSEEANV